MGGEAFALTVGGEGCSLNEHNYVRDGFVSFVVKTCRLNPIGSNAANTIL